jgi:hypothetical protein
MKDDFLDPRFEKLVALLYGELSAEEERGVRDLIARDEEIRLAWEDLIAARSALREWEASELAPSFVFLRDQAEPKTAPAVGPAERLRRGWRDRIRGFAFVPWATAAAAIVLSLLAIGDFRVLRTTEGWKVGFGTSTTGSTPSAALSREGGAAPIEGLGGQPGITDLAGEQRTQGGQGAQGVQIPEGAEPYLTRDEFAAYSAGMTQTVVALLNNYGQRRDEEVAEVLGVALTGLAARQTSDYRDLRGRMEALQLLLLREEQERMRSGLSPFLQEEADSARSIEDLPVRGSED